MMTLGHMFQNSSKELWKHYTDVYYPTHHTAQALLFPINDDPLVLTSKSKNGSRSSFLAESVCYQKNEEK